jgi:hypothetical protein
VKREGAEVRTLAIAGWVVIVGLLLLWQGFALAYAPAWPTISQLFRDFMALPVGRPALFGLWLWLGWHLFARGLALPGT